MLLELVPTRTDWEGICGCVLIIGVPGRRAGRHPHEFSECCVQLESRRCLFQRFCRIPMVPTSMLSNDYQLRSCDALVMSVMSEEKDTNDIGAYGSAGVGLQNPAVRVIVGILQTNDGHLPYECPHSNNADSAC